VYQGDKKKLDKITGIYKIMEDTYETSNQLHPTSYYLCHMNNLQTT